MANYWDRNAGGTAPNPNAPKKPSPSSARAVVEAIRKSGGKPSQAQIDAALNELYAEQDAQGGHQLTHVGNASPFDPMVVVDPKQRLLNMKGIMPDFQSVMNKITSGFSDGSNPVQDAAKFGAQLGIDQGIAGKVTGVGNQVFDALNGIMGQQQQPESIEDMYRRLMQEYMPSYQGADAASMAKQEFAPQFQMLDDIAKQQKARYDANAPKIAQLYAALNDSSGQQRNENAAFSDKIINSSKANADQAANAMQARYKQALSDQTDMYNRLGIQDAAPTTFADQNKVLQQNQGGLARDAQNFQQLNNTLKGNQYHYDTANMGIQKQAGMQNQQDFLQNYLDQAAQTDMQRLQLQSQQQQAQNQYQSSISKGLQDQIGQTGSFVNNIVSSILRDRQDQAQNEIAQAGVMNNQDRLAYQQQQDQQRGLNPYDLLQQKSASLLGNAQAARQFSDVILQAYLDHPDAQNVAQLMEAVGPDMLKQNPAYQSLALDFFQKMLSKK